MGTQITLIFSNILTHQPSFSLCIKDGKFCIPIHKTAFYTMNFTTLTMHIMICIWFNHCTAPAPVNSDMVWRHVLVFMWLSIHLLQQVLCVNHINHGTTYARKNSCFHLVHANKSSRKVAIIAILLCGDIHPNPGPVRFPCGVCTNPVAQNHHAVCCDSCDRWVHIRCAGISQTEYERYIIIISTSGLRYKPCKF